MHNAKNAPVVRKTSSPGLLAAACLAALCWSSAAGAQEGPTPQNPHGELDAACSDCHATEGWRPLREPLLFDHFETGFPLILGHEAVECLSCHLDLRFRRVATACADCHQDPHRGELGFGCEECHSPAGWDNRRQMFDAHGGTLFPLAGAHATLDCAACHQGAPPFEFAGTPLECIECHAEDVAGAELDHVGLGFPSDCELCHSPLGWEQARFRGDFGFDHDQFFELTGAHRPLDCRDCHAAGFAGTPTDCVACHRDDYDATTDPDHAAAGFPTDCEVCHNTSDWEDADFDHDEIFQLTGVHRDLGCESCHSQGFAGTPTDCFSCHADDYNQTDDPDHAAAGFPTECELCHNTTDWDDAEFEDHDAQYFPIFSGSHAGEWSVCTDCHTVPSNFGIFECIVCHEHSQEEMDEEHEDVEDYVWESTACFACHPTGEE